MARGHIRNVPQKKMLLNCSQNAPKMIKNYSKKFPKCSQNTLLDLKLAANLFCYSILKYVDSQAQAPECLKWLGKRIKYFGI